MTAAQEASLERSRVWIFLALVFSISWVLWIPVMLDKTDPLFLNLGGGPALAAMWVVGARNVRAWNTGRLGALLLLIPFCWMVVMLDVAVTSNPPSPVRFDPRLLRRGE